MSQFFRRQLFHVINDTSRYAATWALPVLAGLGWACWPAIDPTLLMKVGLAKDPEAPLVAVEKAKQARLEAFQKAKGISAVKKPSKKEAASVVADEPDEDEEEESADGSDKEEETSADEEEEVTADEEESDDEEEEEEVMEKFPTIFPAVKGKNLSLQEKWDNFTLKSINIAEDDDEDEEDEDEEE